MTVLRSIYWGTWLNRCCRAAVSGLFVCFLLMIQGNAYAAGMVDFLSGVARAQLPDGSARVLVVGDRVRPGEAIVTQADAEVHMRMP